jgi:hypothetical protein
LSKRISRENDASCSSVGAKIGSELSILRCVTKPRTKTRSIGPSPLTW